MIQITPQMRVLVAIEPVDFRRGIDGLSQVCRAVLSESPLDGTMFVFRSRSGQRQLELSGALPRVIRYRRSAVASQ